MSTKRRKTSFQIGWQAERRIIELLKSRGFKIIRHRYRSSAGEIDIIASKASVLHVIEVKQRDCLLTARECITQRQRRRIEQATEIFLGEYSPPSACEVQFDMAFVVGNEIHLLERAWLPGEDRC